MSAPYVPGDTDHPEWWTPADDEILAGELAKLDGLPRPAALPQRHVPGAAATPAAPWWRSAREVGSLLVFGALLGLILLVAFTHLGPAPSPCPGEASGCADVVTPTTYGPPGPAGGFTSMPAAP